HPVPQLGVSALCSPSCHATPAISRWAHGVLLMKRCRNCAAPIEPALGPTVFFMPAILERISLSYADPNGNRQTGSPTSFPASIRRSESLSLLEKSPACS